MIINNLRGDVMKKCLLGFSLFLLLSIYSFAQIAADNASNYGGSWTNGSNGGSGFLAWSIYSNNNGFSIFAGNFLGNSIDGAGDINTSGVSFGLYANPGGAFVNADRAFSTSLTTGKVFTFKLALNFDNGYKGFNLYAGPQGEVFNFNVGGGGSVSSANGATLNPGVGAGYNYGGSNAVIMVTLEVLSPTSFSYNISRTSSEGFQGTLFGGTVTGLTNDLTGFRFYVSGTDNSASQNNLYINSLNVENVLPVELTSFNASIISKSVNLTWQTATEVNNYGFDVERTSVRLSDWEKIGFVAGSGNSNSPKEYSFADNSLNNSGKYSYRLKQVDNDGSYEYSSVVEVDYNPAITFELVQNYPNPFNPSTSISYSIPNAEFVSIKVFNLLGEEVATLFNGYVEAGKHTLSFDASKLSSGMYLYKITAGNFTQVKKMLLAK
jgi:hypothetical protein